MEDRVPGENLTCAEASERAQNVQTHAYEIALDLTTGPTTFTSATTVRFSATPGTSTFIDLVAPTVREIVLNGRALDPAHIFSDSRIALDDLGAENELRVVADCAYMNTGEGLHRFVDPVDDEVYLYSQFEVPDSRRMYAVFEQPDLKATFQFSVTAPAGWQVVSNETTPTPVSTGEGIERFDFEPTPPISSYITAIVAGPYVVQRSELTSSDGRTIPLGVFCRASLAEHLDADYIFDITRRGFEFFEQHFDYPYPFTKYDQLFVPEYNMGAMENAGCVTFTEAYVFRSKVTDAIKERRVVTILHELSHMWFGDLVTMRWWNDLWLNESFAEWASTLATAEATEWSGAWTTFASMEKAWAYEQDQLPSTHPIVAQINDLDDVQVNFDGITYAKGGSVLKQLVAWVGLEDFMTGVAAYFKKHAFSNTELPDLLVELETASGRELGKWAELWLETSGVNTLRPEISVDDDGRITSFTVVQSATADYPTIRPHRLAIGAYSFESDALTRTDRFELDVAGERTDVPQFVGLSRPDLVLLNDDDLTYAKIRLDDVSQATALKHLAQITDPLARALVWGSLWDATRDGEAPASAYVQLVLDNIASETESTTLRTTLGQLLLAARNYVAPQRRAQTLKACADGLWSLAQGAEPGSDAQFQFVKFFAQVASSNAQLNDLAALLDGSQALEGLEIDTDLRWDVLISLVAGGRISADQIDAELASDHTATGLQHAAHARASLPSSAAKQAAWDSVVETVGAPNAIIRATGAGFTTVHDSAMLDDFIPKYFEALLQIWQTRSFHISSEIIDGFLPAPVATAQVRDAALAWLDGAGSAAPAALRRPIIEEVAGLERALAAQHVDAAQG